MTMFRRLTPLGNLFFLLIVLVALLVGGFFWLNGYIYQEKQGPTDYKDATFVIDGVPVTLVDGYAESDPPAGGVPDSTGSPQAGSASKTITRYFGNEVKTDLDGDGIPDLAFLLTQESGGSGTFFYVVGAIQTANNTWNGTHAVLLGDRIAPQTTEVSQNPVHKNVIVVNYADRAPGEPMTAQLSVGKSLYLKLDPKTMQFGEVVQNFEGEADPSRMTLDMKKWMWQSALYNDGRKIVPEKADAFTLTFEKSGRFSATTDCNGVGGSYTAKDGKINFGEMMSTLMYCEGSQEADFTKLLENASGYHFTSRGELILDLKFDSGSVVFR